MGGRGDEHNAALYLASTATTAALPVQKTAKNKRVLVLHHHTMLLSR
jgi:hypothetical protein